MKKLFRRFWPVTPMITALIIVMAAMTVLSLLVSDNTKLFLVLLVVTAACGLAVLLLNDKIYQDVSGFLRRMGSEMSPERSTSLDKLSTPVAVMGRKGEVVWYNRAFSDQLLAGGEYNGGSILRINKDFDVESMREGRNFRLKWEKNWYDCVPIPMNISRGSGSLVYFHNITELKRTEERYEASRPTVMIIVFDNEEELLKARESERVRVYSEVDAIINAWADKSAGICWANVRDKSLIIIEEKEAKRLISERFSILEAVKSISVEGGTPVTLSIGVGRCGNSIEECEAWALQALDMALGRGGDQAVVKSAEGYSFFGGVSKSSERQSKVRIRMLGATLSNMMESCGNCLIMGHRFSDLDAIGSAIGVYAIAKAMGCPAYVVTDENTTLAGDLINYYRKSAPDCFIDPAHALDLIRDDTLLVVTDTHSPNLVESRPVLEHAKNIAVIDHHRMMVDHIENASLMIQESYASSASEIVSELASSMCERAIGRPESEAMLAGIMLDTKNFVLRTGVRTFEASAFLKRRGADTVEVKRMFSENFDTYVEKTHLVSNATFYKNCAISIADEGIDNLRIISAQAADDMLAISGVNASFVLFESDGLINISARSLGRINVQLITEQLGGGGHLTMAGAQLRDVTMDEAVEKLKAVIDNMR